MNRFLLLERRKALLHEEPHEAAGWHVGSEKTHTFVSRYVGQGFGGKVSAADGAFHSGGPSGGGPVASQEYARPRSHRSWAMSVDARTRRVCRVHFLDYGGFHQIGVAGGGEEFADFAQREVDDFGARFVDQGFRGADDEFDVAGGVRGGRDF